MIEHFPTVAVRDEQNKLVAWAFTHFLGSVGNLFVMEEQRRHGLGAYVLAKIAHKLVNRTTTKTCFSNFRLSNVVSRNLHEKVGFKMVGSFQLMLLKEC